MAITQKLCNSGLTAGAHVFQATQDTAVTTIHLCNITSEDATINIYILKKGICMWGQSDGFKNLFKLNCRIP